MEKTRTSEPGYRSLGRRITLAIVAVPFVPYVLTYLVFYYSYNESLRAQVIGVLTGVVESHKTSIDDFLSERLANLRNSGNITGPAGLTQPEVLRGSLDSLHRTYGNFEELALFDGQGRVLTSTGDHLAARMDQSAETWFQETIQQGRHVSDMFRIGPNLPPRFLASVKLKQQGRDFVLASVVDSSRLGVLVEDIRLGRTGEAFIINRQGVYQTRNRSGRLIEPSGLKTPMPFSGVRILEAEAEPGRAVIQAQVWLEGGQWLLVCRQDAAEAFAPLHKAQWTALAIGLLGGLAVVTCTVLLVRRLVARWIQADREKEALNQQIIQSDKLASLGLLVTGVAHEINNPLAIMMEEAGWLEDLIRDETQCVADPKARAEFERSLGKIKTHGRRCKEITHMLLSFGRRSDTGRLESAQLNDLVKNVVGLVERLARSAKVFINLDLDGTLPLTYISPPEMEQVLMNLLKNAVDAMEETGGVIVVRTRPDGADGVTLTVQDNGPGIPAAVRSRIFDPFFTTKPVGKGTGLGLSICYGLVERMGGRIELHSQEGRGTTFIIHLPVRPPNQGRPARTSA
ncbi:MAG: ATP-binding protein [Thermodesulfobacteriota bacterium]